MPDRLRRTLITTLLVGVGLIHLLPVAGVLGAEQLTRLYGVPTGEPNLLILLQHRAVLFGLLGAFLVFAAFRPAYQGAALVAGFISVLSFLLIAALVGDTNAALARVVWVDWLAFAALLVALLLRQLPQRP